MLEFGDSLQARRRPNSSSAIVADCETYIRGHHEWLVRTAKAIGNAYRLEPAVQEQILAELYEVLFRRWGRDLLGAGEHARNGYAHKVLVFRAQEHRAAQRRAAGLWQYLQPAQDASSLDGLLSGGADVESVRASLLDFLTSDERDVIVMVHGLNKDEAQIASELGMQPRAVARIYESAAEKLRTSLRPLASNGYGGARW